MTNTVWWVTFGGVTHLSKHTLVKLSHTDTITMCDGRVKQRVSVGMPLQFTEAIPGGAQMCPECEKLFARMVLEGEING